MGDLTNLGSNTKAVVKILARLEELMDWERRKFKTKKSSIVLR